MDDRLAAGQAGDSRMIPVAISGLAACQAANAGALFAGAAPVWEDRAGAVGPQGSRRPALSPCRCGRGWPGRVVTDVTAGARVKVWQGLSRPWCQAPVVRPWAGSH